MLEVYGVSIVTSVTAQNLRDVRGPYPMAVPDTDAQIDAVAYDMADADEFTLEKIKVNSGEYFGQGAGTQSLAGLLAQSLKWGTHDWEVDVRVTGLNTELTWTTDTWKKDLPEAKETTISQATDVFYLSMPSTYEVTVKLIPVGAYAGDSAGKVMAEGTGTFQIPAAWAE